jgi:hypothetical protein
VNHSLTRLLIVFSDSTDKEREHSVWIAGKVVFGTDIAIIQAAGHAMDPVIRVMIICFFKVSFRPSAVCESPECYCAVILPIRYATRLAYHRELGQERTRRLKLSRVVDDEKGVASER